ncbi:unnamed protein product [Effrenium voratum]|nr:unnamed protein product [Effrenium voratum]
MLAGAAKALAGLKSLYVLPRTLWIAFGIYFVLGFLNVSSMKLYLPLLRSLVVCDAPVREGLYSGSLRCGDFAEVISVSLQQEAWLVGVKLLCRMVSGPILGALCDSHGRKPVLLLSVAGFTLASWLIALAVTQDLIPPIAILTFALAVQGLTTAFKLCFNSMIADLLDKEQLQKGFVVLNHVDVLSRGLSLCFVIWIQKVQFMHFGFLCSMAGSLGVVVLLLCHRLLPETLTSSNGDGPKGMAKDMSLPGLLRSSFAELQAGSLGSSRADWQRFSCQQLTSNVAHEF